MPRNSTPSYRLHRATGQAVVTLSGRDHYLGRHGTPESHKAYDDLIARWLACGRRPLAPRVEGGPSVDELLPDHPMTVTVDIAVNADASGPPQGGNVVVVGMLAGDVPIFILGGDKYVGSARVPDEHGRWRVTFEVPSLPPLHCKIILGVSVLDPATGVTRAATRFSDVVAITGRHASGIVELVQHISVEQTGTDGTQP